ncbi:MAG: amino acid permease [Gammaproteobacteria bacterium]|nr:amino acid permease [Gammaproteobacteria bacterium]
MTDLNSPVQSSLTHSTLKRSINLPLLVLYGLGTTIGAGIYVLVGGAAGRAGLYAPMAFIIAAVGIAPTVASYAELVGRYPQSAAEATYIEKGFRSTVMSTLTGSLVIFSGIVAAAAITVGCAGYIQVFVDIPLWLAVLGIVLSMGLVAAWGILESVLLAALFTLIEVGGLLALVVAGFYGTENLWDRVPEVIPNIGDAAIWAGIASAGLLAVFAFIGFEDMVNVVEETKRPSFTMPMALALTLLITALLYALVTLVSVLSVAPETLAGSTAPLSTVYETLTGRSPIAISAIAIFATLNTILIQFIMASRVIYGMADQSHLPKVFAQVNRTTRTPLLATVVVVAASGALALAIPLDRLAESTSILILFIWTFANLALLLIKIRKEPAPKNCFVVPLWVPMVGLVFCCIFIAISIFI